MTFDTSQQTLIADGTAAPLWLIELDFTPTPVYLATWGEDLTYGGKTYMGVGNVLSVGAIKEAAGSAVEQITLSIPALPSIVALALGNVEGYRGRSAKLSLALLGTDFNFVGAPKLRFSGVMQPIKIERSTGSDNSTSGRITMDLSRAGLQRSRRTEGRRLTDAQQRARFPGDTGLRYLRALINNPTLWLSKEFQKQ